MNSLIEFLNLWGTRCLHSALPMLLQASLLIVVLLLLDLTLERYARAVVRYGLWLLLLVKLVLPPSLALPTGIGYWLDTRKQRSAEQTMPATTVLRFSEAIDVEGQPKFSPPRAAPALSFAAFGLLAWIAGSLILFGILVCRSRNVARRVVEAAEAPAQLQELLNSCCRQMGVRQATTLKLAGFAMSPAACGLLRPVILVPEELVNKLSMLSLRAVMLHELAHIKRGDLWVNYFQTLIQIVYWYHPLLWLANAQIRRVREQAVDEMAMVEMGEDAETYPATLLEVARTCFARAKPSLGLVGIVESGSALAQRLKRLVNRPIPTTSRLTMANVLLCLLAGAALLPMAHGQRNDKISISAAKVDPETIEGIAKIDVLPNGEYVFHGQKMPLDQLHSALHKEIHKVQESLIFEIQLKGAATQNDLDKLRERLRWLGVDEAAMIVGEKADGLRRDTSLQATIASLQRKIDETKQELENRIRVEGNDHPNVARLRSSLAQLEAMLKMVLANGTRHEAKSQNAVDSDPLVSLDFKVDRNFLDYFGERGAEEIDKALKVLNDLPPMSSQALGINESETIKLREGIATLQAQSRSAVSFEIKLLSLPPSAISELALGMPISTNEHGNVIWKQTPAELSNLLRSLKQRDDIQTLLTPRVTTLSGRQAQVETSDIQLTPDLKLSTAIDLVPYVKGDQIDLTVNAAFTWSGRIDSLQNQPDGANAGGVFSVNATGYVTKVESTRVTLENDQSGVIYYPTKDLPGQTFLIVVSAKMTQIFDSTAAPANPNRP